MFGSSEDWRLFTEGFDADLDQTDQVRVGVGPLVKVGQIDLATAIHMFGHLDLHVRRGLDEGQRGVERMCVQQGDGYRDVVVLTLIRDWDGPHQVQEFPLTTVIKDKLLPLGGQPFVVVEKSLDVLLGEVRVLVSWLHGGEEAGQDGVVTLSLIL